jgi:hypothetical protein
MGRVVEEEGGSIPTGNWRRVYYAVGLQRFFSTQSRKAYCALTLVAEHRVCTYMIPQIVHKFPNHSVEPLPFLLSCECAAPYAVHVTASHTSAAHLLCQPPPLAPTAQPNQVGDGVGSRVRRIMVLMCESLILCHDVGESESSRG